MPLTTCPDHGFLRDFRLGKLPVDSAGQIAEHLDICATCQANIETISDSDDTLVHSLRQAPPNEYDSEPDFGRALAAIQAMGTNLALRTARGEGQALGDPGPLRALRDYQLLEELGAGGMGTVYKARHQRLKRIVAVKLLPPDRTRDKRSVARFEREIEAVGKLEHPNVVRALDAGEQDGQRPPGSDGPSLAPRWRFGLVPTARPLAPRWRFGLVWAQRSLGRSWPSFT